MWNVQYTRTSRCAGHRDNLEYLNTKGRVILKWILSEEVGVIWTE